MKVAKEQPTMLLKTNLTEDSDSCTISNHACLESRSANNHKLFQIEISCQLSPHIDGHLSSLSQSDRFKTIILKIKGAAANLYTFSLLHRMKKYTCLRRHPLFTEVNNQCMYSLKAI